MAQVMRTDEMAALLKTSEKFLIALANEKEIPHIRQGDLILLPKEEVLAVIAAKGIVLPDISVTPGPVPVRSVEESSSPAEAPAPPKRGPGRPNSKAKK
jgi:excisionase family DNA binding protein